MKLYLPRKKRCAWKHTPIQYIHQRRSGRRDQLGRIRKTSLDFCPGTYLVIFRQGVEERRLLTWNSINSQRCHLLFQNLPGIRYPTSVHEWGRPTADHPLRCACLSTGSYQNIHRSESGPKQRGPEHRYLH